MLTSATTIRVEFQDCIESVRQRNLYSEEKWFRPFNLELWRGHWRVIIYLIFFFQENRSVKQKRINQSRTGRISGLFCTHFLWRCHFKVKIPLHCWGQRGRNSRRRPRSVKKRMKESCSIFILILLPWRMQCGPGMSSPRPVRLYYAVRGYIRKLYTHTHTHTHYRKLPSHSGGYVVHL